MSQQTVRPDVLRGVVRQALSHIGQWSEHAEELVMLTAAAESNLRYVVQIGGGPARSHFQIEKATERDIFDNYLAYRKDLRQRVIELRDLTPLSSDPLRDNPLYSAALCRIHYRRVPERLPFKDDVVGMAKYHKKYFNTSQGKAEVMNTVRKYHKYILGNEVNV